MRNLKNFTITHTDLMGHCSSVSALTIMPAGPNKYSVVRTFGDQAMCGFMVEGAPETCTMSSKELGTRIASHLRDTICMCGAEETSEWTKEALATVKDMNDPVIDGLVQSALSELQVPA